jgi:hypothetical protein
MLVFRLAIFIIRSDLFKITPFYEDFSSFFASAAPKISPKLAPLSDDPYSAMAFFSSSISLALIEREIFLVFLSILVTVASTLSPRP